MTTKYHIITTATIYAHIFWAFFIIVVDIVSIRECTSVAHGHHCIECCMVLVNNRLARSYSIHNDRTNRLTDICRWDS